LDVVAASREDNESGVLRSFNGLRALIVNENQTSRDQLKNWLSTWGFRCISVESPSMVMKVLDNARQNHQHFDLGIIDMHMSSLDGESLGEMIKIDPDFQSMKLVLLTGIGKRGDVERAAEIGFSAYLTKPVKQAQLHDCLKMIFSPATAKKEIQEQVKIITRHMIADFHQNRSRILVVEDNLTNQKVARKILEKLGYNVDVVSDGMEALEILKQQSYGLVLMDIQMPGMGGLEATCRIRDFESGVKNPAVPVVAMTAGAMTGDREKCLKAGMNDYISKPFRAADLDQMIRKWLKLSWENEASTMNIDSRDFSEDSVVQNRPKQILNQELLLEEFGDDRAFLDELLEEMLIQVEGILDSMQTWDQSRDWSQLTRMAHTMKSSCANVFAEILAEKAGLIEFAAINLDDSVLDSLLQEISDDFKILRQHIAALQSHNLEGDSHS